MKLALSFIVCLLFVAAMSQDEDKKEKENKDCNQACSKSEDCKGGRCCRDLDGAMVYGETADGTCLLGKATGGELCDQKHCHCGQGFKCYLDGESDEYRCFPELEEDDEEPEK